MERGRYHYQSTINERFLFQGELLTMYTSLPFVAKSGLLEYPLPNKLNISFSYYMYMIFTMFAYIPGKLNNYFLFFFILLINVVTRLIN